LGQPDAAPVIVTWVPTVVVVAGDADAVVVVQGAVVIT
jgi:hypothetical protein